ncbi:MAG: S41 family peptidase [Symploca sp. SIO1A3]|nr:S41 family peptidase [Symploca sp. SIO1A3]
MKRKFILGAIAISVAGIMIAGIGILLHNEQKKTELKEHKDLVDEVWQSVNREYIEPTVNNQDWQAVRNEYLSRSYTSSEETYKAIQEMLELLGDPQTQFLTPDQFEAITTDPFGIGIFLTQDEKTGELKVITSLENSPAFAAGILPGDVIVKINGQSTQGVDLYEGYRRLQVPESNQQVILTVRRRQKELEFRLTIDKWELKSVHYSYQSRPAGSIGYIRLSILSADGAKEMRKAIEDLEKKKVSGYILDLRSNPGGVLYAATEIAEIWLSEGIIVSTVDRQGQSDIRANNRAFTDKPLVVLVDKGTGSASEILAGALQDNQRAVLVGTRTLGNNRIQSVKKLKSEDGSGLSITIAKWQTAKGEDIYNLGLTPDVELEIAETKQISLSKEGAWGTPADPQYAKAQEILTGLIKKQN